MIVLLFPLTLRRHARQNHIFPKPQFRFTLCLCIFGKYKSKQGGGVQDCLSGCHGSSDRRDPSYRLGVTSHFTITVTCSNYINRTIDQLPGFVDPQWPIDHNSSNPCAQAAGWPRMRTASWSSYCSTCSSVSELDVYQSSGTTCCMISWRFIRSLRLTSNFATV